MEKFLSLPAPVQWMLGVTGTAGLVATGFIFSWTFFLVLLVLLLMLLGSYILWTRWKRKRQNAALGGELQQHSSASPRGISDPGQRARLDDLRKKFQTGIEAYRSRGKDLYKLPWYVIVGEPGSGKTEAIRHSNVGFPPGMQDEFQGVGGTINMNWWFTNHAVLLDTAGRLMFEEVKPGETSEWKEFLGLLKKNRPTCPVNGLFLVIPSDSLILNSADEISQKAGRIAQQLDAIQRVLDVRFPVFVVITKCDKLNGFREFFDGVTDPQLQHQMMGWSNPDPLDTPFRPDLVDQHLEKVAQRLRRRRLVLLRDPVPESASGRRTDEVDSLYAFPHSLTLISSRLRRYLETIFVAGEWSAKPLFLRGIYFSSSMREGAALDKDLADAIGVNLDALPEGKVWERERAYFLRDMFMEKAFRERDLVTRASNTSRMLRQRQVMLFMFGFFALAGFATIAWVGKKKLNESIKVQSDYWSAVAKSGWVNKTWKQGVVPVNNGVYTYSYADKVKIEGAELHQGDFHLKIRDLATTPLKNNWMFPGLAQKYNASSTNAQRIVFESGVIKPLLEAAREKMRSGSADPATEKYLPSALVSLIQLEADVLSRASNLDATQGSLPPQAAANFLGSVLSYITATDFNVDTNLVAAMVWTYSDRGSASGSWPPAWVSGAKNPTNDLAANPALKNGLEAFINTAKARVQSGMANQAALDALEAAVKEYQAAEKAFYAATEADGSALSQAFQLLESAKRKLDEQYQAASGSPLFQNGTSLTNGFANFNAALRKTSDSALAELKGANASARRNLKAPVFADIQVLLEENETTLSNMVALSISPQRAQDFRRFDEAFLAKPGYLDRWSLYQQAVKLLDDSRSPVKIDFGVGDPVEQFQQRAETLGEKSKAYSGKLQDETRVACSLISKAALQNFRTQFLADYIKKANATLSPNLGFPVVNDTGNPKSLDEVKDVAKQLAYISKDIQRFHARNHFREDTWQTFTNRIASLTFFVQVLAEDDETRSCSIRLLRAEDPPHAGDAWRDTWRLISMGASTPGGFQRTQEGSDVDLGKLGIHQSVKVQLKKSEDSEAKPYDSGMWGPLWLIAKWKGKPALEDGKPLAKGGSKFWTVDWPVGEGKDNAIRLLLAFDRELPELGQWPQP